MKDCILGNLGKSRRGSLLCLATVLKVTVHIVLMALTHFWLGMGCTGPGCQSEQLIRVGVGWWVHIHKCDQSVPTLSSGTCV